MSKLLTCLLLMSWWTVYSSGQSSTPGFAQGFAPDQRYLRAQTWLTGDGLPQDSVHQVLQSADGFLWLATEGGLARFDGVQFRSYTRADEPAMRSDDLCCLAEGGDGSLWVGSSDGMLRFRGSHVAWYGTGQGLPSTDIHGVVAAADGSIMVLTADGLVAWHEGGFQAVPGAPVDVQAIFPSRAGVWLVVGGKGLLWRAGGTAAAIAPDADLGTLAGIVEGQGSSLWLYSNTAVEFAGPGEHRVWRVGAGLPGTRVLSLFVDRRGTAWAGTNDGIALLDGAAKQVAEIAALRGSNILQTYEDREGNFWFGTETSGLHVLRPVKFRGEAGLAGEGVSAIVQSPDAAIWVGTRRDGLRRVRKSVTDEPVRAALLTSPVILSLTPGAAGSVWAGTPDGLNQVSGEGTVRRVTSADGLPDDYVQALATGDAGQIWVGTRRGLARVQGARIDTFTVADGLANDLVGALLEGRDGTLWIGTANGLTRRAREGRMTTYTAREGLSAGVISALAEDGTGALWIAEQNSTLTRFAHGAFHAVPGVIVQNMGGRITGLAVVDGWLWLREDRAIGRVALAELNRCIADAVPCAAHVTTYGTADGILSEESVAGGSPSLWQMTSGELWIATRRGVAITEPEHMPFNALAPPVSIERVLVDDDEQATTGDALALPFGHTRLTIEYAALSFTAPAEVRYRFMLEGFDRGWTAAGSRRAATYTNLPPGHYRFTVQASNNDGVWSSRGAELRLHIVPPYTRRWWFILLELLLLTLFAFALYQMRLRRLKAGFDILLQERNRLAREIHDTLAQDFVGVTIQLDLMAQMLKMQRVDAALDQVRTTRALVTDGLAEARRSIWALRANATESSLPSRLRALTQRLAEDSLKVELTMGGAYRKLPPMVENEVLRIAQESLANVRQHAGATQVTVSLSYESDMLVLCVQDNGRGFDMRAMTPQGHYGLQGMRERAEVLGASLEITSEPGAGTKVCLMKKISGVQS